MDGIEVSPWEQAVNFPNATFWQPSVEESDVPAEAIQQFKVFREAERHLIRTDTVREAVTALESLNVLLHGVFIDVTQWKWVLQTLHSALQAFMVAALQGTSPVRVLKPLSKKELQKQASGKYVERKLKPFLELYDCIQDEQIMAQYTTSQIFKPNLTQDNHVKELNRVRNGFVHFTPKSYIYDVWELPALTQDIIEIIRFLAFKSENVPWHYGFYPKIRTHELLHSISQNLEKISEQYMDSVKTIKNHS
jgi:hypothetical protein